MQVRVPKPLHGWRGGFLLALCCFSLAASARAQAVPAAIDQDPPLDRLHPASGAGMQFISNGKLVNAMEYLPSGAGPHPAVILLHGITRQRAKSRPRARDATRWMGGDHIPLPRLVGFRG
jgi:hypothetical protein